ncbi:MAG: hypothetical protein JXA67_04295 [Micromonosporaceae bacterium]|nr:hypothetical protein [Micromonosporaceae bacterium]
MGDLLVNLLASVIAAIAAWLAQRGLRYRALARKRAFFSVAPGERCLMVVAKHASSPSQRSVANRDVAALVELATVVKACGGDTDLALSDAPVAALGRQTEFCVGGPTTNPRMAVHLRAMLPGVRFEFGDAGTATGTATGTGTGAGGSTEMTWWVGETPFRRDPERVTYAILAKVFVPGATRAVFLVAGQVAAANLATARFLAARFDSLASQYGVAGRFCLVLRVTEPEMYGPDFVEIAADVSEAAFVGQHPRL